MIFPFACGAALFRSLRDLLRRHSRRVVIPLVLIALLGGAAGGYAYAFRQWQVVQEANKERRLDDAKWPLEVCLFVWPRNVKVRILAARAARLNGDFATAEAHLNRCLKLEKDNDAVEVEFLLMRVQRGQVEEVAPLLMICVQDHHPETPLILRTLAGAYMHNVRYARALIYLDRWIQEDPECAEAYEWRGWVLERMNKAQEGVQNYRMSVELAPERTQARFRLAEMLLERNDPEGALEHLQWLLERFPERTDVRARLGYCRYLQGRLDEAKTLLEAALPELPEDQQVLIHLGRVHMQQNHPAQAEPLARRALAMDGTNTEARFLLSQALRRQGRVQEAEKELAQHNADREMLRQTSQLLLEEAERPSSTADDLFKIASVFLRSGQDRLALYWLDRALQRDPQHQPSRRALAEYYEKKGEPAKAEVHRRQFKKE
jgi:tetratricopeptide (TPR) repeat protein